MVKSLVRNGFAALLLVGMIAPAKALVEVSVDRNPVQMNETFQLVFTLDQMPDRDPDFSVLRQNFIVLGDNRSSSISIVNGDYRRSVKWTLQLMARDVGEFEIPAIRFDHERSEPLLITVKPSSPTSVPEDKLVLEVITDRPSAYVQSQVVLTLRLLSAVDIAAYQFGDISISDVDAVVEPLGDVRQYQTRIEDRAYLVLEKQFALFPQQSGRMEIAPVLAEVRLPSRKAYDPFQTGGEVRRLRSMPLAIDIEPIPAVWGTDYWLPARQLELQEQWQDNLDELVAGEPITRSLTLTAEGLTAAQIPELPLPAIDGIKQYPDQPALNNRRISDGIRGSREQKVALIPSGEGRYRIPEIRIPWWNLQTGSIEYATLPAREIIVYAAPAVTAGVPEAAPAAVENQPAEGAASPAAEGRFWPWLALLLACGWGLSALYWMYRARPPAKTAPPEQASLRQASRELARACRAGDAEATRQALLPWGQALLAPRRVANLHQLCALLGDEFAREVENLNQSRYSRERGPWRGEALAELCRRLEASAREADADEAQWLPLNPTG